MSPERCCRSGLLCECARVCAGVIWFAISLSAQGAGDLPAGKGADRIRSRCLVCHGPDLILSQRLTRAGWQRELDKMIRWGAAVPTEEERGLLLDYLTTTVRPQPVIPSANERGAEIFTRRCVTCHQADIVQQQRLDGAAWTREIDKMVRWGAVVGDVERAALIEYLANQFGRPSR